MRHASAIVVVSLLALPASAAAEAARSAADATVFIRLVGNVHANLDGNPLEASNWDGVEIGSGSGFVISPYGYVLTNDHVVRNEELLINSGAARIRVKLTISKIQVCFPTDPSVARGTPSRCSDATVYASDPEVDLAVLFIAETDLPYLALGDSDAVGVGAPVEVLGYPFGRQLNLGQIAATDLTPEVSTTPGAISALRSGEGGEPRFLQVSSNLNPGNSGGPIVDRDGYVVGVARMKLAKAAGIGFAIPVNQVKDFLESHGLEQLMPARRFRLGPLQNLEEKGVRVRLPEGLGDVSPYRTRVETADMVANGIVVRIDRVFSPMSSTQLEQVLLNTQTFERLPSGSDAPSSRKTGPLLIGETSRAGDGNLQRVRMAYAIVDLGPEKLVARYVGSAEQIAFNQAAVRESLASLEGHALVSGQNLSGEKVEWSTLPQMAMAVPAGWVIEAGAPTRCPGTPPSTTTLTAFARSDFTVTLRAAVWSGSGFDVETAASSCPSRRGSIAGASYSSRAEWLGAVYSVEGVFVNVGVKQVLQLEAVSPIQKAAFARAMLTAWIETLKAQRSQ